MRGRDKYALVIMFSTFVIIGLSMPDVYWASTFIIVAIIFSAYVPLAYLYIAKVSEGDVRRRSSFIFSGFIIIMLGSLLPGEQILVIIVQMSGLERIQVHSIAFGVMTIGVLFLYYGLR